MGKYVAMNSIVIVIVIVPMPIHTYMQGFEYHPRLTDIMAKDLNVDWNYKNKPTKYIRLGTYENKKISRGH